MAKFLKKKKKFDQNASHIFGKKMYQLNHNSISAYGLKI